LEKKRLGLTVHYRQLPEQMHGSLQAAVRELTQHFKGELRVVQGPKAWEITPAESWNKGTAVRLILADLAADSDILFYAGDGANDTEAIEEVAAMGGITVGIGPDAPSTAEYRLRSHAVLRALLRYLDASLERRRPHFARSSQSCLEPYPFRKHATPTKLT
jgi:trehalose 6-phosphate phosphatase